MHSPLARIRNLCVLAAWLCLTSCGSDPKTYIARGNDFFDARRYDDAALQYQKALQKNPLSGDAHYRLAVVELKREHPTQAYREITRAVELMPEDVPALSRQGQLALSSYNADPEHPAALYFQAVKDADLLLRRQPAAYEGNLLRGAIDLVDRKPDEAATRLRTALQSKPGDPEAALGLARALAEDHQTDAALALAHQLIARDRTFGPAYDFLYGQYAGMGKIADAENILKQKVSGNPKQTAFLLELARFYQSAKRPDDVVSTLAPAGPFIAGDFYASAGEPDLAIAQYQAGLQGVSKEKNLYRRKMAALLAAGKRWPETYSQLEDCLRQDPADKEAKSMRAIAWLDEGRPENLDPAIAELSAQLKQRPQDAGIHFQLGNALAQKGDREGARREWSAAARQKPGYLPPRYALAQMSLAEGKPQDALRIAEEIVALAPDERARLLRVTCQIRLGLFEQAGTELTRLVTDYPRSARVRIATGVLALSEKRYRDAEGIFAQLASLGDGNREVLSGMTQAWLAQNEPAKALQSLQDELKRHPASPVARQLLAQAAMASGRYDLAIEQYHLLASAFPTETGIQRSLAAAYGAKGDTAGAMGILQAALKKDPAQVEASLDLAHLQYRAGRIGEAKTEYRRMLKVEPNNPAALNDLSYLMAESGENLDEALALDRKGAQFATEASLKTSLLDTMGWIYLKKNMNDSALQAFQAVVNGNPGNMTYRYHLGTTLYQMGNKSRARAELEAALAARPKSRDEPKIRELLTHL